MCRLLGGDRRACYQADVRALGMDVGSRTIGLALSDSGRMLATAWETISRKGQKADAQDVIARAQEQEVDQFVIGWPLELDGSEDRSARLARQVGEALSGATDWPVFYVDERFSSVDAERQLIAAGMSRQRRKEVIDQQAAVLILQSWLDHPELQHGE